MLDYLERLRTDAPLRELLNHYAELAQAGREIWQDRLMAIAGVDAAELSRLHGHLIAFDWIEQNTGHFGALRAGAVTGCYRVTPAGLRVVRLAQRAEIDEDSDEVITATADAGQPAPLSRGAAADAITMPNADAQAA